MFANFTRLSIFRRVGSSQWSSEAESFRGSKRTGNGWRNIAVLILLQISAGVWIEHFRSTLPSSRSLLLSLPAWFTALETLKLGLSAVLLFFDVRWRLRKHEVGVHLPDDAEGTESLPLTGTNGSANDDDEAGGNMPSYRSKPRRLALGTTPSTLCLAFVAFLFASKTFFTLTVSSTDTAVANLYLSSAFVPLFSGILLYAFLPRTFSTQQWSGIILQFCGIYSSQSSNTPSNFSWSSACIILAIPLYTSFAFVALDYVYRKHTPKAPHSLNIALFTCGLILQAAVLLYQSLLIPPIDKAEAELSMMTIIPLFLHAAIDVVGINVIYYHDAVSYGVSTAFSATVVYFYSEITRETVSLGQLSMSVVTLIGFAYYMANSRADQVQDTPSWSLGPKPTPTKEGTRTISAAVTLLGTFLFLAYSTFRIRSPHLLADVQPSSNLSQDVVFADLSFLPPPPPLPPKCRRDPLPSINYFKGNRTYHEFDDVLLIVFFSHARYDVNLDFYKEVYAELFPNIVFVGPRSREEMGFRHSYDVLVDSYEGDEDISDWNYYKMAGRMAHHMLYTVLTTPPYSAGCYNGYLWAPFDTLLNAPRLQQFDQDKLWYFSPWGEYVPNPAIRPEHWANASFHAPPARISPDPETNFTEVFKGWWVDWWWGDPHFGIPVCLPAFERVPYEMRERMSTRFLNETTRFLGGSADTLYVPERLKADFLEVLGLFLETNCFLEIAVPTTVHLIVPEDENILFVDHWWIWNDPLNATFVRNTWKEGMEVDTFHTFHWGDKGEDGVWRAIPENIEDVRQLLRESAERQNVSLSIHDT